MESKMAAFRSTTASAPAPVSRPTATKSRSPVVAAAIISKYFKKEEVAIYKPLYGLECEAVLASMVAPPSVAHPVAPPSMPPSRFGNRKLPWTTAGVP